MHILPKKTLFIVSSEWEREREREGGGGEDTDTCYMSKRAFSGEVENCM